MRRGFTMIELIFVIVIIGILAVIAIPKLNATRDDAKIATNLQNLSTCIQDIGSEYTATGKEPEDFNTIPSCKNLIDSGCFAVEPGDSTTDGTIVVKGKQKDDTWCVDATKKAYARNLVADENGAQKEHKFGGNKIVE
ncbi:MAG: type II secretion system protein [Epsilonproteobacteria bacterium]|nr:type II secretion system protein [Campylobacterota bacterium]